MEREEKQRLLEEAWGEWADCTRCGLCDPNGRERNSVVFGEGDVDAPLMIIGEAPGRNEDQSGSPFEVEADAGGLFEVFLGSMRATRDEVFVTNVVGCRPTYEDNPNRNRAPSSDEIQACLPRVQRIVEIVDPYILLLLGNTALKAFVKDRRGVSTIAKDPTIPPLIAKSPGQNLEVERPAFATWHPSYLLRPGHDSMAKGSERHKAYLTWMQSFKMADWFNYLYNGITPPDRESE